MLRTDATRKQKLVALSLALLLGVTAALLVVSGNPGNMGLCGACFLRDIAGSLGLGPPEAVGIFRPEVVGIVLGAFLCVLLRGRYAARSGSHAVSRMVLGVWMGMGSLVFLGCPFRLLQRLGGGDMNAWLALPGFLLGVAAATRFESNGYTIGRTARVPAPVGLLAPIAAATLLAAFFGGGWLRGPGPGDTSGPAHAHHLIALGLGLLAGWILSLLGFCAISAARQLFAPGKRMLWAACALIAGYAMVTLATGRFRPTLDLQPIAHGDWLMNLLALALVGVTGAFAGGCPMRQLVMAGEGNGDAFITVVGILVGAALAHNLGVAASPAGVADTGRIVVGSGILFCLAYACAITRAANATRAP